MEKLLKQLIERVDVLIKMHAVTGMKEWNQTQKIMRLHMAGIAQADIASILGIKINNVTATVSRETQKQRRSNAKTELDGNERQ